MFIWKHFDTIKCILMLKLQNVYKVNVPVDEQMPVSEHLGSLLLTFKTKKAYFWIETADFDTEYCFVYQALKIIAKFLRRLMTLICSIAALSCSLTGALTLPTCLFDCGIYLCEKKNKRIKDKYNSVL